MPFSLLPPAPTIASADTARFFRTAEGIKRRDVPFDRLTRDCGFEGVGKGTSNLSFIPIALVLPRIVSPVLRNRPSKREQTSDGSSETYSTAGSAEVEDMQRILEKMMSLACLAVVFLQGTLANFSPPTPIPFHTPQYAFPAPKEGSPHGVLAIPSGFFLPPPLQQGERRPALLSSPTVQRPPPPLASLPWEVPERPSADPFPQREQLPPLFAPIQKQQPTPNKASAPRQLLPSLLQQQAAKTKQVKGGPAYPKKWIPGPADGKKIKPKSLEKHRKQLVVLSSTTNKELRDDEVQVEPEARVDDVLRTHHRKQPKNKKYPGGVSPYEPLPVEARYPKPATPPASKAPELFAAAEDSPKFVEGPKPYAHNHQQEASGSGFTPLFAAEAAGSHHGFVGHETAHPISSGSGDRVAFHIHGEKGPKSYRFGYDTGKGPDRHFRYEQRDDDGNVKGHFGFYDKHGKLQVVHYSADPKNGFSADGGNFGKHEVL
ncbi:proteoglycan 4-like [Hetaerina americana]|uniref:proteoglycan 4-like n=1 Tax=Hetaerina americana TaxID=62018 RepID=UPI003A7F4998